MCTCNLDCSHHTGIILGTFHRNSDTYNKHALTYYYETSSQIKRKMCINCWMKFKAPQ